MVKKTINDLILKNITLKATLAKSCDIREIEY